MTRPASIASPRKVAGSPKSVGDANRMRVADPGDRHRRGRKPWQDGVDPHVVRADFLGQRLSEPIRPLSEAA